MSFPVFMSQQRARPQGYKSVDTESTDDEHNRYDDESSFIEQNEKSSIDSQSLLKRYNDEEQLKYHNPKDYSSWSLRGMIFVCGNIVLSLIFLSRFFTHAYQWSSRPNEIYRQVTTYCKYGCWGILSSICSLFCAVYLRTIELTSG